MDIILQPRPDGRVLSAADFAETVQRAGLEVELDRRSGKRGVIEQIIFAYKPMIADEDGDLSPIDRLVASYADACRIEIFEPRSETCVVTFFLGGENIRFSECYPTDKDPESLLVMRIAQLIGYQAKGE